MKELLIVSCMALFCTGCGSFVDAECRYLTTRKVGSNITVPPTAQAPKVEGKSSGFQMLGIPLVPLFRFPNLHDAVEEALKQGKGNLLVDATVHRYYQDWSLGLGLFLVTGTTVEGKVVTVGE